MLDILFHRLTTWLAPVLVFTMEEVWLERFPGDDSSVHLLDIPETPAAWKNPELAEKWAMIRSARRVVTSALEVQRSEKVIGASLEAAPSVTISDPAMLAALQSVPFEDICITSALQLTTGQIEHGQFTLADHPGIGVAFSKAEGEKCQRCWKILPDVGQDQHPGTCRRCSTALSAA